MTLIKNKIINKIGKKIKQRKEQKEYLEKKKNNKEILGYYNMKDLENNEKFFIKDNFDLNEINNLRYTKEESIIEFTFHSKYCEKDESQFYQKLTEMFKILEKHERTYNIKIKVENRELFEQSKALEHIKNINLTIRTDLNNYTKEEYIEEEIKLNSLVEPIKNSNLSPYEKYLAVYNIVKQFKEYKENKLEPYKAREIKEILKNEYMVCVGYANLLTILLDKINIPCISISAVVEDQSYTSFLPLKDRPLVLAGHERNLIKIDDDKYNIHGIYIADPTFDNDINADLYNNASVTYDKFKESNLLEKIRFDDYIFDIHNFDEFVEKVNYCLKYEIRFKQKMSSRKMTYEERIIDAYHYIYINTLKLLYKLDKNKWYEYVNRYHNLFSKEVDEYRTLKDIENIYSEFLTDLAYYIIELSNKEIDIYTTLNAAKVVKKIINGYSDKEIENWENMTKTIYEDVEKRTYPYKYDPNEIKINYLEEKYKSFSHAKKITHSK